MKIYNEEKTQILNNPNLENGYLKTDKIVSKIVPEQKEVKEQFHYVTIQEYENGGKDVEKVIDIEYQPYVPEHEEYEEIMVYIPYTQEELKERRIDELKQYLIDTDYKVIKYAEGCITFDEYTPIKLQRQLWRDEINQLEDQVKNK